MAQEDKKQVPWGVLAIVISVVVYGMIGGYLYGRLESRVERAEVDITSNVAQIDIIRSQNATILSTLSSVNSNIIHFTEEFKRDREITRDRLNRLQLEINRINAENKKKGPN